MRGHGRLGGLLPLARATCARLGTPLWTTGHSRLCGLCNLGPDPYLDRCVSLPLARALLGVVAARASLVRVTPARAGSTR